MKDLKFKDGLNVDVTFRTDMINSNDQNFTVMAISNLGTGEEALFNVIKKLPNDIKTFKAFATDNNLDLIMTDSDGSNEELLVNGSASHSEVND